MTKIVSDKINAMNKKTGEISSLLILPLLGVVMYEVILRYVFNAPTIWGFELTIFLYGIHFVLGYSYTDCLNGHVRVDVLTAKMSVRSRAIMDSITLIVIFFPVMICLVIWTSKFAITSAGMLELNSTSWAPPIYPIKILMAIGFLLVLLQGISHLISNINIILGKETT